MLSLKYSFKLVSFKKTKEVPSSAAFTETLPESIELDNKKRSFLKFAGMVGAGAVAASLVPRRAEALVFGSTPTSNTVGVKNALNAKINPATEETLATRASETTLAAIKTQSDKLTFDGSTNLLVAGDVGLQNASNITINPATEETLTLIQTQTNKLTFDVDNNLLTASSGGASLVGLKDTTDTQVNPATDDAIVYLRRMVKLMESQATVDGANRQRITLDAAPATVTVTGTVTSTVTGATLGAGTVTNATIASVAGQNQQMYQDVARNTFANGIRQNLVFS